MTVEDLLRRVTSRELTEWQLYLDVDAKIQDLVQHGTEPSLAYQMVWDAQADDDAESN